ncbi:MAG: DJ-1/PfpI family protein [Bifidobacteriaceae bacterium]|jgi:4-methyl-5(b-hydroxyethyl)-thiazole monophosphate biosynthesis|nr:DJ-1/PfpI family protein [Bifidobacteriaceae bacterium]
MKKIALFAAHGSETIESLAALDVFRRADLEVDFISIESTLNLELSYGTKVQADRLLSEVNLEDYSVYYLPGGMGEYQGLPGGVQRILSDLGRPIKDYFQQNQADPNKLFCAICAAPLAFHEWGLLGPETKFTSFDGVQTDFAQNWVPDHVVRSGNLFTSRGAGTTIEFALAVIEAIVDAETALRVKRGLQIKN